MESLNAEYVATLTKVLDSLFGNFQAPNTAQSRSAEAVDDEIKAETAAKIAGTNAEKAKEEHFAAVQEKTKSKGLEVVSDAKKAETLKKMDKQEAAVILADPNLTAEQKSTKLQTAFQASITAVTNNVGKSGSVSTPQLQRPP